MTSKEVFIKIREIMNEYHHQFVKENIKVETIEGYPLDQIEKDLKRLEAIDNAKPSEAIKSLESVYYSSQGYGDSKKHYEIVKQALLKAQEQDKILEILKSLIILTDDFRYIRSEKRVGKEDYKKIKEWLDGKN